MKRGRKDVYTASGCEAMRIAYIGEEISARTRQARFYQYTAKALLAEAASDFPEIKAVYHHDTVHRQEHEKPEILEQIGRMYMQDGFPQEDCIEIARVAGNALSEGYTVKQMKAYIANGRKTGQW